jgi:hypothetical protein
MKCIVKITELKFEVENANIKKTFWFSEITRRHLFGVLNKF